MRRASMASLGTASGMRLIVGSAVGALFISRLGVARTFWLSLTAVWLRSLSRLILQRKANLKRDLVLDAAFVDAPALLFYLEPLHVAQGFLRAGDSTPHCVIEAGCRGPHQFGFTVDFAFVSRHSVSSF